MKEKVYIPKNIIDGKFRACGHEAVEENIYIKKCDGYYQCRTCIAAAKKKLAQKNARKRLDAGMMF